MLECVASSREVAIYGGQHTGLPGHGAHGMEGPSCPQAEQAFLKPLGDPAGQLTSPTPCVSVRDAVDGPDHASLVVGALVVV